MDNNADNGQGKPGGRGQLLAMLKKRAEQTALRNVTEQQREESSVSPMVHEPVNIMVGKGRSQMLTKLAMAKQMHSAALERRKAVHVAKTDQCEIDELKNLRLGEPQLHRSVEQPSSRFSCVVQEHKDVQGSLSDLSIQKASIVANKKGTYGQKLTLGANYVDIQRDPNKGLFIYEIKYRPDIDSRPLRIKLLSQHAEVIGKTRVFDGTLLYLPQKTTISQLKSVHPSDGSDVNLTLVFKKEQTLQENIAFFNTLLGRLMKALNLIRIGQHSFNPNAIKNVPQHKLEVWPGYAAAIHEFDGGLKLCIDAKHRVIRTDTAYDYLINEQKRPNYQHTIEELLTNVTVLTRYNNATYRIDDIDWDKSPMTTFSKGGHEMTLVDYYKTHWNLTIKDTKQPLLIHRTKKKNTIGETEEVIIWLIPELCYIAGLTDDIRANFNIMKSIDSITKASPSDRREIIKHFIQAVKKSEIARDVLAEWGLQLSDDICDVEGRLLPPEVLIFGENKQHRLTSQRPADWSREACVFPMIRSASLKNWFIFYTARSSKVVEDFTKMFMNVSSAIGMKANSPRLISLPGETVKIYVDAIRENMRRDMDLAVIVFPTPRDDRYAAVKRLLCVDNYIPSQVINYRTISRGDKLKSITEKIALQINCKLGGALWSLAIPMDNFMICGIDVYHGTAGRISKRSASAFVANLDKAMTSWHSRVCFQGPNQEIIDVLQGCLISAVNAYYKKNNKYPDRIIIYRDGVGEGQMDMVRRYEVKQFLASLECIASNYKPKLTVIIVQKQINTRIFGWNRQDMVNPQPGTVTDGDITLKNYYDFFLVAQTIRQGTVSPTHYIVIYDSAEMKADHVQRLTYKLCHLYYNWPGTIKVPAPCQYAHKLAFIAGLSLGAEPHVALSNHLYYL